MTIADGYDFGNVQGPKFNREIANYSKCSLLLENIQALFSWEIKGDFFIQACDCFVFFLCVSGKRKEKREKRTVSNSSI